MEGKCAGEKRDVRGKCEDSGLSTWRKDREDEQGKRNLDRGSNYRVSEKPGTIEILGNS